MLDWVEIQSALPPRGLAAVRRQATASECERLARELGLLALSNLDVTFDLKPRARDRWLFLGTLRAQVEQACVVSLEPVSSSIEETFEVEFRGADDLPPPQAREETLLDQADIEPMAGDKIPVGRIVYETLAAAIDPFPRRPDATLSPAASAPKIAADNPFAALAKLKSKP